MGAPRASAAEGPQPTAHTRQAYDPIQSGFTAKWTRADARQIMATQNDPDVEPGDNSMPVSLTMPDIPADFPLVTEEVWVWDTWPLTDQYSNQVSYRGWDIIFSLVAPREIPFDERHWSARIGWFIRCFDADPDSEWNDQGHVFEDDTSLSNTEWSGSARYLGDDLIRIFYTATTFGDKRPGTDGKPAVLATVEEVNASGAYYQRGNIGLAWADNNDLTAWTMLPPILSAYGVNDQTERPQMIRKDGLYYLYAISHQYT